MEDSQIINGNKDKNESEGFIVEGIYEIADLGLGALTLFFEST